MPPLAGHVDGRKALISWFGVVLGSCAGTRYPRYGRWRWTGAEQSNRPGRRIPAGSGGCLCSSQRKFSRELERASLPEALSNKQLRPYYTHTKRQERLHKPIGYEPFVTLALCSGNKDNTNLLREHVWTPDYERTATSIQAWSYKAKQKMNETAI